MGLTKYFIENLLKIVKEKSETILVIDMSDNLNDIDADQHGLFKILNARPNYDPRILKQISQITKNLISSQ